MSSYIAKFIAYLISLSLRSYYFNDVKYLHFARYILEVHCHKHISPPRCMRCSGPLMGPLTNVLVDLQDS